MVFLAFFLVQVYDLFSRTPDSFFFHFFCFWFFFPVSQLVLNKETCERGGRCWRVRKRPSVRQIVNIELPRSVTNWIKASLAKPNSVSSCEASRHKKERNVCEGTCRGPAEQHNRISRRQLLKVNLNVRLSGSRQQL